MKQYNILFPVILFLFVCTPYARGASYDLSGTWHLVANGRTYVLELTQRGKTVSGTLVPTNNSRRLDSIVEGSIWGERVRLTSINQEHSVVLRFEGVVSGSGDEMAMSGTFTYNSRKILRWYAIKQ